MVDTELANRAAVLQFQLHQFKLDADESYKRRAQCLTSSQATAAVEHTDLVIPVLRVELESAFNAFTALRNQVACPSEQTQNYFEDISLRESLEKVFARASVAWTALQKVSNFRDSHVSQHKAVSSSLSSSSAIVKASAKVRFRVTRLPLSREDLAADANSRKFVLVVENCSWTSSATISSICITIKCAGDVEADVANMIANVKVLPVKMCLPPRQENRNPAFLAICCKLQSGDRDVMATVCYM
eukprot:gb/GEZN01006611.1/.p1 GENE.gb/GEZN01006611.1/~~gb/GEZN01006611.1/.p1  ORF type:complete len:244 (-),score=19.26 gb/GEZN01006611.1/:828-1559(-)